MLAFVATSNSLPVTTAYPSGQAASRLPSEPVQHIAPSAAQPNSAGDNPQDKVTLSPQGLDQSRQAAADNTDGHTSSATNSTEQPQATGAPKTSDLELSAEDEQVVQQLKERDQEVKTHEMAHLASAGQYARGGPTYTYQQGPDGRRYAIGGEVPIDLSKEKTPEETIQKMRIIRAAAMAPAEPSSADRNVAATASAQESQARREMQTEDTSTTPDAQPSANRSEAGDEAPARAGFPEAMPQRGTSVNIRA
jgi:hypothetical protein